jgi:two-component system chemotaxis response regulator CheB
MRTLSQELIPKIQALTSQPQPVSQSAVRSFIPLRISPLPKAQPISSIPTVLAIGVSTGGPAALDILLPALPVNFPLPVLIVQHMPELFTGLLAERLNSRCPLRVHEGVNGEPVSAGVIYIARGNWHLEVQPGVRIGLPATLRLNQGALENHCRPAVDVLFRSAAAAYGSGVLAVVLTGMGSDGMLGARMIREYGGAVLAQDQASSAVWGMPGAVTNAGLANNVLPLNSIAAEILRLAGRSNSEFGELRESVV